MNKYVSNIFLLDQIYQDFVKPKRVLLGMIIYYQLIETKKKIALIYKKRSHIFGHRVLMVNVDNT